MLWFDCPVDMQKNGLDDRSREKKVGFWVGGISTFFLVSFFLGSILFASRAQFQNYQVEQTHYDYQSESAWGNVQTDSSGQMGHNPK